MANYRFSFLLQKTSAEPAAHSERWDFIAADDTEAKALAVRAAVARAKMLPRQWKVLQVRVGKLTSVEVTSGHWRFKQVGVAICSPANAFGTAEDTEISGGAAYYSLTYTDKPGKAVVRLITPIPENWWSASSLTTGSLNFNVADQEFGPWVRYLRGNGHRFMELSKATGVITPRVLECYRGVRSAVKRVGRDFFLRRGRKFAHRTHPTIP